MDEREGHASAFTKVLHPVAYIFSLVSFRIGTNTVSLPNYKKKGGGGKNRFILSPLHSFQCCYLVIVPVAFIYTAIIVVK